MADHFEEVIGLRVSALEARVIAEAEAVKEHFAELQNFITFSLTRQTAQLRTEFRRDIRGVKQRLGGRIGAFEQRFDRLEQRVEGLDRKADVHYEAVKLMLTHILGRLPARSG